MRGAFVVLSPKSTTAIGMFLTICAMVLLKSSSRFRFHSHSHFYSFICSSYHSHSYSISLSFTTLMPKIDISAPIRCLLPFSLVAVSPPVMPLYYWLYTALSGHKARCYQLNQQNGCSLTTITLVQLRLCVWLLTPYPIRSNNDNNNNTSATSACRHSTCMLSD